MGLGLPRLHSEADNLGCWDLVALSYEQYVIWGYYGTHYRVRLYPPFGYSILYKEYYLTEFNH